VSIAAETEQPDLNAAGEPWRSQAGIPLRNLWVLLLYASDLAEFADRFDGSADDRTDLPELIARLLNWVVERRLRQNLSRSYVGTSGVLHRVRGRIDWLRTVSGRHLDRGEVVCRYEELTADTARNRLIRAALETSASSVADREVARNSAALARLLAEQGVGPQRPSRSEMARDRIARHDAHDKQVVTVAHLALEASLPNEDAGSSTTTRLQRDEKLLRRIFERAVAGLYKHELDRRNGWTVRSQKLLAWHVTTRSEGFAKLLPGMNADVVLERRCNGEPARKIVVETKFADALTTNAFQQDVFKSAHLYQLYAYLRSQAGRGEPADDGSSGLLLYPVVDGDLEERGTVQGHEIKIATVDLTTPVSTFRHRLLDLVEAGGAH
jgi:5-methylcytosine-specific restriction enzyme subunit McrC